MEVKLEVDSTVKFLESSEENVVVYIMRNAKIRKAYEDEVKKHICKIGWKMIRISYSKENTNCVVVSFMRES